MERTTDSLTYTYQQAADTLGVSYSTIRRRIAAGVIKPLDADVFRGRIAKSEIENILNGERVAS